MKKWLCAAATAGFCALSMTGVFADNLVLPQGEDRLERSKFFSGDICV